MPVSGGTGEGTDTIIGGSGPALLLEGSKNYIFNGNGTAGTLTTVGGTGSATVFAGNGGGLIQGGSNGRNILEGAASGASTTLVAGGNGDLLVSRGTGPTTLAAATGNETLIGGGGADTIQITNGKAGGNLLVVGFRPAEGDRVQLQGYEAGAAGNAVAAAVGNNGLPNQPGAVITLSDGTKVTFSGVTNLTSSSFV